MVVCIRYSARLALLSFTACLGLGINGASAAAKGQPNVVVPPPVLTATNLPGRGAAGTPVTVTWSTGSGVPGAVFLEEPKSAPLEVEYGDSGTAALTWIKGARTYIFDLSTIGQRHMLLARMTIASGRAHTQIIARSWVPGRPSRLIDRILQLSPFAIAAMFIWLTLGYLRSLRVVEV
jgi:hypothetical protein